MSNRRKTHRFGSLSGRGATLAEAMVAVSVTSLVVLGASQAATQAIKLHTRIEQKSLQQKRSTTAGLQLAQDIRMSGMGSAGSVGVHRSTPFLGDIASEFPGPKYGVPAIFGVNNRSSTEFNLKPNSDIVMLVVPNPGTLVRTEIQASGNTIPVPAEKLLRTRDCPYLYVHDHSGSTGTGKTQIEINETRTVVEASLGADLLFSLAPGAAVMCAQVVTYWIDQNDYLHRSILQPDCAQLVAVWSGSSMTRVSVCLDNQVFDSVERGIASFQTSYRMSSAAQADARLSVAGIGAIAYRGNDTAWETAIESNINRTYWSEVRGVSTEMILVNNVATLVGVGGAVPNFDHGDLVRVAGWTPPPANRQPESFSVHAVPMSLHVIDEMPQTTFPLSPY